MSKTINVTIDGVSKEYPEGISLWEISRVYQEECHDQIMLAFVNHKLSELRKTLHNDAVVRFVTIGEDAGYKTYTRGLTLVLLKAIYQEMGKENVKKVSVEYTIDSGVYCDFEGSLALTEEVLQRIEKKMKEYVEKDLLFDKKSIDTDEAIRLFEQYKMYDKQKLFRYRRVSRANVYNLDGFEDYFYGYMPYSTGCLKYFRLFLYDEGFIMLLPHRNNPETLPEFKDRPKFFQTVKESNEWGKSMDVDTIGALNDVIAAGQMSDLILVQESMQEKKIADIAASIAKSKDKKFVMIAGPSSSGKTTFSHRLSIQLRTFGLKPHPIAVDDYFVDREKTPVDEEGNFNFECLEAIDVEQFNKDMTALLNGERVELPSFNFKTGKREYKGNYKQLGPDDILVIEGIHGLNDKLSYSLPRESKYKIYISALTSLNIDEHNRIQTTDGRLLRRMIRDARTRGTLAKETIAMWKSVRNGEENYIFPFQEEADVMFNSAMIYELAVLKPYAEPILFGIPKDCKEYVEAKRLLKFFDYVIGVSSEEVPHNSILREFIGGSIFNV
ncbi:nucleoside kinase [[Clostridium] polysaccharolyticum]|uniref:Uridine kinase n=1 Tax=[Clostridium] polysaccharolyticum TaxID=29364 RepID=A0A1I0CZZ2_9FIRM|nr:nucleoside kinase [[Clostridium] polysaccharolyticum]SET25467.1 uridine kinase [[Clostridium] polysaccharolyticum]